MYALMPQSDFFSVGHAHTPTGFYLIEILTAQTTRNFQNKTKNISHTVNLSYFQNSPIISPTKKKGETAIAPGIIKSYHLIDAILPLYKFKKRG